jgi:lipoprotein-releasing system permease protein
MILIVACCNVLSFLVILVNDKKKEIGILQAMGARRSSIVLIFGGCGAAVGLLSSLVGTALAFFTLQHLGTLMRVLSIIEGNGAMQAAFYGMSMPNQMSFDALLFVIIAAPILSIIAGFVPALKACSVQPSETLRSD